MTKWITISEQYKTVVKTYFPNFNKNIMTSIEYHALHGLIRKKMTQQHIIRNFQITKAKGISTGSIVLFEGKKCKVKQIAENGKVQLEGKRFGGKMVTPLSCELYQPECGTGLSK